MNFKKDNLCPIHEECLIVNDEKRSKNDAIIILEGIDRLFDIFAYAVDSFANSMGDLLLEAKYNLYRSVKVLDPEFPWEDPFSEKEEHDESVISVESEDSENVETKIEETGKEEIKEDETEIEESEASKKRRKKIYKMLKEELSKLKNSNILV